MPRERKARILVITDKTAATTQLLAAVSGPSVGRHSSASSCQIRPRPSYTCSIQNAMTRRRRPS